METASAVLADALRAIGILAIRLRQIQRRVPHLTDLVNPGQQELARLTDDCDTAHELLGQILAEKQDDRRAKNRRR